MPDGSIRVAVDIGGTFTDVQVMGLQSGEMADFKSPTTPQDPSIGLVNALTGAAARFDFHPGEIEMILHGSTIATNAVLERKLPETALITTAGFTDVLEIGRHMRHNVYSLKAEPRSVLVPRHRRFGVSERLRADGSVETALDADEVAEIGRRLVAEGVSAVAIVFLHGYRNPVHERMAADVLSDFRGLSVATSHEASPEIREFERASTTVLNAALKPVISGYLSRLEERLAGIGVRGKLFLVQSNGGVATTEESARLPAKLLLSGPAGGATAMVSLARRHGLANMVGVDMGGTSSDVSVVQDGDVEEAAMGEIDGLPVRLPMIEIRTIGAGGGSIARAESGALRVGPQSAGARPGPACYGRGGREATVTDANLHLGLIDPTAFLGGEMVLDETLARDALRAVAEPLGLRTDEAALGIIQVANTSMAAAVRLSLFEKGADPADFVLTPFGGAGGLHACASADELEIDRILFPATASTLSARGILTSDLRHDLSRSELFLADKHAIQRLSEIVSELFATATGVLEADGVAPSQRRIEIFADLRYRGQAYEISTPWKAMSECSKVDGPSLDALVAEFHQIHQARYAHSAPDDPVEIVTIRTKAIGVLEQPDVTSTVAVLGEASPKGRKIWTPGGWRDVPVYPRGTIGAEPIAGPLVVQEDYAVLYIETGWSLRALDGGDLMAVRQLKRKS